MDLLCLQSLTLTFNPVLLTHSTLCSSSPSLSPTSHLLSGLVDFHIAKSCGTSQAPNSLSQGYLVQLTPPLDKHLHEAPASLFHASCPIFLLPLHTPADSTSSSPRHCPSARGCTTAFHHTLLCSESHWLCPPASCSHTACCMLCCIHKKFPGQALSLNLAS
jgi:hypothetical protein